MPDFRVAGPDVVLITPCKRQAGDTLRRPD